MVKLADILGQEQGLAALTRAYLADRLPHGMIFAGAICVGNPR